jgi:RimJ/RimL family protein N-acetyltransferase
MTSFLFETPRLIARHLSDEDVDAMAAVYGDADAMRWVGDGQPLDRSQCVHWVEVTHNNYASRGYGMTALIDRATGDIVGFCGLVHLGGQESAELKYALRREYWGKGLATEAARGMLHYGHERFGLDRVIATVAPEHKASQKVLLKAGMKASELRPNADGTFTQVFVWNSQNDENAL